MAFSEFNLSNLNGSNGFTFKDVASDTSYLSYLVSGAGDINNDGIDDLIIGASSNNAFLPGQSYVVFGRSSGFPANFNLSNLNGSNGFVLRGGVEAVNDAGDVNNDGIDDLIIGAPYATPNGYLSGQSYVVFGRSSGFSPSLDLSSLNGSNGFAIFGSSGNSVSGAGDVNNDGIDDLIVSNSIGSNYSSGKSVVFGRSTGFSSSLDLSSLNSSNGLSIPGASSGGSGAGDINNDGIDDLIVSNSNGQGYVVFGVFFPLGTPNNDALMGTENDDTLEGLAGNDTLSGRLGNDVLDGGSGNDVLMGQRGDDFYIIDTTADSIVEIANQGTDTIRPFFSYTLGLTFERLGIQGSGNFTGTGNTLDNYISGNAGNNVLMGLAGNDTLMGGEGIDTLMGGSNDDTYYLESISDRVLESVNQGTDTVRSFINYILEANVERLGLQGLSNLRGTGNTLDNYISGNVGNNVLMGLAGNDTLMGGEGIDTLMGGSNDDMYYLGVIDEVDEVVEGVNQGTDTVRSFINYILEANVERLGLQGFSNLEGTGNSLANYISGNFGRNLLNGQAGNDSLNGGVGDDTLYGGAGNDLLIGDIGDDLFFYSTGAVFTSGAIGVDLLTDFRRFTGGNTDKIVLS
jgi:Ca2+-binding RTX toxin-like protein